MLVWMEAFDVGKCMGPDRYVKRVKAIPTLATLSNITATVTKHLTPLLQQDFRNRCVNIVKLSGCGMESWRDGSNAALYQR